MDYFPSIPMIVDSNRILYTASPFARGSLLHLQEIGELKALQAHLAENPADAQAVSMFVLRTFYMQSYDTGADFYEQFAERLTMTKEAFGVEL